MKKIIIFTLFILLISSVEASRVNTDEIFAILLSNGSTTNANGDYSTTPSYFAIQPPSGEIYILSRFVVGIEDNAGMDITSYGNGISITKGIMIQLVKNGTVINMTTDPIQHNGDWGKYCYDIYLHEWGQGNDYALARCSFFKSGAYIKLNGSENDKLQFLLEDDFSDLVEHTFVIQGYKETSLSTNEKILNSVEMDGMAALSITLFLLAIAGSLFITPKIVKKFHENWWTDTIIRRAFIIAGIYVMVLISAMMATISETFNLGLEQEFLQTFVPLFGWAGYGMMVWMIYKTIVDLLSMYKNKRDEEYGY